MIGFNGVTPSEPSVPVDTADVNSYVLNVFAAGTKKADFLRFAEAVRVLAPTMLPDLQMVEVTAAHVKGVTAQTL